MPFKDKDGREMLGAYASVRNLGWGVIVQEPKSDAYLSVKLMTRITTMWGILTISGCINDGSCLFKQDKEHADTEIEWNQPSLLQREISRKKINITTKNEIGQLAHTFNYMAERLDEVWSGQRELFVSTIKSLAAAMIQRTHTTDGHSERVASISTMIAKELGLPPQEVERCICAALPP